MKKILKWLALALGGLAGLIALALAAIYGISEVRLNRLYDIPVEPITVPTDTIAEGERLARARGCADCHGENLGGGEFLNIPGLVHIYASNLTGGDGGVAAAYSDEDFVRAIRSGVGADGKPLMVMPADEFYYLSDHEVGAIIAYVRSVPPVDNVVPDQELSLVIRGAWLFGVTGDILPAEAIDHDAPRPAVAEPGTLEYGEGLAVSCTSCHGETYSGGPIPMAPPDTPVPANITPDEATGLGTWSEADFVRLMRDGTKPDGSDVDPMMPWRSYSYLTDDELHSLWLYLQSLPPLPEGNR